MKLPVEQRVTVEPGQGGIPKLDRSFNRATLKSRSERGRPVLSDLQGGPLGQASWEGDVRRRPKEGNARNMRGGTSFREEVCPVVAP